MVLMNIIFEEELNEKDSLAPFGDNCMEFDQSEVLGETLIYQTISPVELSFRIEDVWKLR
jgi:hypothetical protein